MKHVDQASISVQGGDGGRGVVSFRREKYVPRGGPDGGDGGKGGDVILTASSNIQTLLDLKVRRLYKAKNGKSGGPKKMSGSGGKDVRVNVPRGTMIFDDDGKLLVDLKIEGDSVIVANGGQGGRGNFRFSSSVNRIPREAQPGTPGEEFKIRLELRMIADVGIVGLPNAGKSTLLKILTSANPKIAAYPFTTLFPNLGLLKYVDREIVLADIPGLIEGASKGVGLGDHFLRHIDRTRFLVHLVSVESTPELCWENYQIIHNELSLSPYDLQSKGQLVVLTKTDIVEKSHAQETVELFRKNGVEVLTLSAFSHEGLEDLKLELYRKHDL
jgi:GTP-binding protein